MEKESFQVKVSEGRRVVLPSEACQRLNVAVGDTVIVEVDEDDVRLRSWNDVLREMQEYLARTIPVGTSAVDDLLGERREEAARE